MAPVIEKEAKVVTVRRDTALLRPDATPRGEGFPVRDESPRGMDNDPDGTGLTSTVYLCGDFADITDIDELPREIAGHRVVRSLDPARWPHFPDAECQKEWDELDR